MPIEPAATLACEHFGQPSPPLRAPEHGSSRGCSSRARSAPARAPSPARGATCPRPRPASPGTAHGRRRSRSFQAAIRSTAGSPAPRQPQSIAPVSRPSCTRTFRASRSACSHTRSPCHSGAAAAASHSSARPWSLDVLERLASPGGLAPRAARHDRRPGRALRRESIRWSAATRVASSSAASGTPIGVSPSSHRADRPVPRVDRTRPSARDRQRDLHRQPRCKPRQPGVLPVLFSRATLHDAAAARRARSPSRKIALSVPDGSTRKQREPGPLRETALRSTRGPAARRARLVLVHLRHQPNP